MVVATLIKIALSTLHLPPIYEGLVFSLNHATVFCAAYLLHYTIATKLPAHTAAALAIGRRSSSSAGPGGGVPVSVTDP
jgi:site-specific recombinase